MHWMNQIPFPLVIDNEGKVHSRTGHDGPEREQWYSSIPSLTPALDWGGWTTPQPCRFIPGKDPVPTVREAGWASEPVWTHQQLGG